MTLLLESETFLYLTPPPLGGSVSAVQAVATLGTLAGFAGPEFPLAFGDAETGEELLNAVAE